LLRCAGSFHAEASVHAAASEIQHRELPEVFRHLNDSAEIDATDAAGDPRTAALHRLMLAPLKSRSLVALPIRRRQRVVGSIWLEDPTDAVGYRRFLRVLAGLGALRDDDAPHGIAAQAAEPGLAANQPPAACSHSADPAKRGLDVSAPGEALHTAVSVVVMRLDDLSAAGDGLRHSAMVHAVVQAVQELAAERAIRYLKLVGYDIVGAAGFVAGNPTEAARIASIAIASRDRISELFKAHRLTPNFRLGIDSGAAIGQAVGAEPALFNLWGEAVQTARTMVAASLPRAIQVSEAAYQRLRHSFLFRPRGTFYPPPVGCAQTFVLAGRL